MPSGIRCLAVAVALYSAVAAHADDCPLAGPRALVAADALQVRSHAFASTGERASLESITLASGAKLELRIGGCEYFVLAVRHETTGRAPADARSGYAAAADALVALAAVRPRTIFDLPRAAGILRDAARGRDAPQRDAELPIDASAEPVPLVVVRDWGAAGRGRRFVALDLIWGPA